MIVIVCVDDKLGMAFNHRRQSMDDTLRRKILEFCGDHKIWMRAYTAKQFGQYDNATNLITDEDYLSKAAAEDYAMVETDSILPFASDIQGLVLESHIPCRHFPGGSWQHRRLGNISN